VKARNIGFQFVILGVIQKQHYLDHISRDTPITISLIYSFFDSLFWQQISESSILYWQSAHGV